jgi:Cys-tRNA(Pro)/Cys-tRNA(Cys) deacylase
MKKTNAMRFLENLGVSYSVISYESGDGKIDGVSVAHKIGRPVESVYKTLVVIGHSGHLYVMIIPVDRELDLKKAAKAAHEKSVHMLAVADITKHTGYVRGGCSPFAMKKHYLTFLAEEAILLDKLIVSAGQIGLQIEMSVDDFAASCPAELVDLVSE